MASGDPSAGTLAVGAPDAELDLAEQLDVRESYERDGIRVVSAGPNAFVYFLDTPRAASPLEAIEATTSRSGHRAGSKSPGGRVRPRALGRRPRLLLARPVRTRSRSRTGGPFDGRDDRAIVTRDLAALMAMRSAGDLVVYGTEAPEGHVSYIDEFGAHAGPSREELHTFLVAPTSTAACRLGSTIRSSSTKCSSSTRRQSPRRRRALGAHGRHP